MSPKNTAGDISVSSDADVGLSGAVARLGTGAPDDDLDRFHALVVRLSTYLDLDSLLRETLHGVTSLQGSGMGTLRLFNPATGALELAATLGLPDEYTDRAASLAVGEGASGMAFAESCSVVVEDVLTDPIFADHRASLGNAGIRAVHSLPLCTHVGEMLGTVSALFPHPHQPSARELRLVELFAYTAANLISNARLYAQAQEELARRRRTERALRRREVEIRRLIDSSLIGIFFSHQDGYLYDANDAFLSLVGYSREQLRAGEVRWTDLTPPEYLQLDALGIEQARSSGTCRPYEKEYVRRDGTRVPVLIGYTLLEGSSTEFVGFVIDLTPQREMEHALRESEERFRNLAEALPQIVWTATPDGRVDYTNRRWEEYSGIPRASAGEDQWLPAIHPEDREATRTAWQASLRAGELFEQEHRLRRADGTYHWHLTRGVPLYDDAGQVVKWFGTATDIDERKQSETDLRKAKAAAEAASRAKSEFLAIVSHELRTPLNSVIGYEELLEDEIAGPLTVTQRDFLARIRESAWRLLDLINEILSLSRIESDQEELDLAEVDAIRAVRQAAAIVRPDAEAKGLAFRVDLPTESLVLWTDPAKLRQILLSLLSNAIKFTEQGTVEVVVRREGGSALFQVRDTGIGVEPEHQDDIFEPFFQVEQCDTRSRGGTGLGLSVTRRLAQLLGGDVTLKSAPGRGSTFSVRLPA